MSDLLKALFGIPNMFRVLTPPLTAPTLTRTTSGHSPTRTLAMSTPARVD